MLSLGAAPYGYARDELVVVRAKATNLLGIGPYSSENTSGATLRTLSDAPSPVTRGSETSEKQIVLSWTAGDSSILSYNLVVWNTLTDQLSTSLVGLDSPFTTLTFTYTDGIVEGTDYTFKLRTQNIYGWGPYSPATIIKASDFPSSPSIVTTSIVGTTLRSTWN